MTDRPSPMGAIAAALAGVQSWSEIPQEDRGEMMALADRIEAAIYRAGYTIVTPDPGSPLAFDMGCKCPRIRNHHGKGVGGGGQGWEISRRCPLHGHAAPEQRNIDA